MLCVLQDELVLEAVGILGVENASDGAECRLLQPQDDSRPLDLGADQSDDVGVVQLPDQFGLFLQK